MTDQTRLNLHLTSGKDQPYSKKTPKVQLAPKYHTKGCSHSSLDNPRARTLVFAARWPHLAPNSGLNSANTLLCDTLAVSPNACPAFSS